MTGQNGDSIATRMKARAAAILSCSVAVLIALLWSSSAVAPLRGCSSLQPSEPPHFRASRQCQRGGVVASAKRASEDRHLCM